MRRLIVALLALGFMAGCAGSTPTPKPEIRVNRTGAETRGQPAASGAAESGKASWYGEELAGRPTASGEPFDPSQLTAATPPKYAFQTRLRVTCAETGKSVVVRVNDRFRPKRGRIIDLSKAAFQKLAPIERGVLNVTVEPIP